MIEQDVVVYVSNNCRQCNKVLSLLEDGNVPYTKKNTSVNKDYMKELQGERIYGTPATFVNNEIVLGMQKSKLQRVLGI
ncbi:glutaredoxin family protein [Aquibacillus saliphilus]|uniref:glutaredoxin family protein n=1 Tax=Aquibacillus saliphilus TaxID=1909422 RepID=UPI001CF0A5EE|nr:glutaredoxin domain-containing protein [Aquibacillus saliphilus]